MEGKAEILAVFRMNGNAKVGIPEVYGGEPLFSDSLKDMAKI